MAKQINAGIGGVVKKVKKVPFSIGGVVKEAKKGVCGIGGVVKTFYTSEYASIQEAYNDGALSSLVVQWGYDKDDGEEWSQYSYVSSFTPSSEKTFDNNGNLASKSNDVSSDRIPNHCYIYLFCPTQEAAQAVAELIESKYTTVNGRDAGKSKYFGAETIDNVTYSTDTCANIQLRIPYWWNASSDLVQNYWDAYTASGYSDKYVVTVECGAFISYWDESGNFPRSLDQIIFS